MIIRRSLCRGAAGACCGLVVWLAAIGAATAGPALLYDPVDDRVLYAEDADHTWYPASLTKLMTAYLTFEAVKDGRLTWDAKLLLSDHARGQLATRIGLRAGINVTIDQAVRGLILRSANDFAVALAETIDGAEEKFIERMNATAKRLGMTRTKFANPHGLPDPEQVTTARDLAILTRALIKDFPAQASVFSAPDVLIHRQTMYSGNDLLRTLLGADGMKTGFTCGAGYNVVASATRNGRRLIAVVLGEQTRSVRSYRAAALLEHGFDIYDWKAALAPRKLAELPLDPPEANPVFDMSKAVRTNKCGNRGGEPKQYYSAVQAKARAK